MPTVQRVAALEAEIRCIGAFRSAYSSAWSCGSGRALAPFRRKKQWAAMDSCVITPLTALRAAYGVFNMRCARVHIVMGLTWQHAKCVINSSSNCIGTAN